MNSKYFYHGSHAEIKNPDLMKSRIDIDFGPGFYLTTDKNMALKWASRKQKAVINTYTLNFEGLNVVRLGLTQNWLEFVSENRGYSEQKFDVNDVDVIIGPTADDKMFDTLSNYFDGNITAEQAIKYLNIAGYSDQVVLKTEKAVKQLSFEKSRVLKPEEKDFLFKTANAERKKAIQLLNEMIALDKKCNQAQNTKPLTGDYPNEYEER